MKINLPAAKQQADFVQFHGGLDVVSPPISIPPGFVRNSQNFEEDINGGYSTVKGYEAFDGRTSPSAATFSILPYSVRGTVAIGDTLTGGTSGATGKVISINDTAFVLTQTVGTFTDEVANSATVAGPAILNGAGGQLGALYKNLAADVYRALITVVPGAGNVLGVYLFKGILYAFRNKSGSGVGMYKATSSGWVEIALGIEVYFNTASGAEPAVGATITQGGVSATLAAMVIESGTFGAGTAAGRFIFATVTAGPFVAGAFTAGVTATAVSQAAITIPNKNGRFSFVTANFYGQLASARMYGADGVNRGFEFDGTTFIPINTGTPVDTPLHVTEHSKHLFFSFGSSAIHSAIGNPLNWQSTLGASEIAVSDTITGFAVQTGFEGGSALAIYSRNSTHILYGSSAVDWEIPNFDSDTGAIQYSIQTIGKTYVLDDRGIISLATSQNFGNFAAASISQRVKTLLDTKRSQVTDSHVARDKQQYRLFFSDLTAVYCTIGQKEISVMPIRLDHSVLCSVSDETYGGGSELTYFGSSDGFVYQMDKGTSFNGGDIEAFMYLVFNHSKSYRALKKYRRLSFEMVGTGYSEFKISYELSKGGVESAQSEIMDNSVNLAPPKWNEAIWNEFIWNGQPLTDLSLSTPGIGDNISVKIKSNSDYFLPVKFSGVFIEYSPLRMRR